MKAKTKRVWYWITTILFSLVMLFSAIGGLFPNEQGIEFMMALGYPRYINLILGVAKIFGIVALFQTKFYVIKEWAYAGFTFDLLGAASSTILAGLGFLATLPIWVILAVMFVSYTLWKKN